MGDWADINSLMLYFKVENGSGYDVACSGAGQPIIYFANDDEVSLYTCRVQPILSRRIFILSHLNKKQDSKQGIKAYLKAVKE